MRRRRRIWARHCAETNFVQRIVAGLEYDGAPFCGWQSQKYGGGIQDAVQRALAPLNGGAASVIAAGRTDAGVHSALQIVHFDAQVRPPEIWRRAANAHLPKTIRMLWAHPAPPEFHARHSAVRRHYRYLILNRPMPSAFWHAFAAHCPHPLNVAAIVAAAKMILGAHDFSAFRAAACQAKTPCRTLYEASVRQDGEWLIFDFCADGFLHKMVRNIVGALLAIGKNRQNPEIIGEWLAKKSRALCPPPAPPCGLYFCGAEYRPPFAPPQTLRRPLSLPA